jgi:hypothetical protein
MTEYINFGYNAGDQVVAKARIGDSDLSGDSIENIVVQTQASAPQNLAATRLDEQSIILTWDDLNGPPIDTTRLGYASLIRYVVSWTS